MPEVPRDDDYETDIGEDRAFDCAVVAEDGSCPLAGTEYCDSECPYLDDGEDDHA